MLLLQLLLPLLPLLTLLPLLPLPPLLLLLRVAFSEVFFAPLENFCSKFWLFPAGGKKSSGVASGRQNMDATKNQSKVWIFIFKGAKKDSKKNFRRFWLCGEWRSHFWSKCIEVESEKWAVATASLMRRFYGCF